MHSPDFAKFGVFVLTADIGNPSNTFQIGPNVLLLNQIHLKEIFDLLSDFQVQASKSLVFIHYEFCRVLNSFDIFCKIIGIIPDCPSFKVKKKVYHFGDFG